MLNSLRSALCTILVVFVGACGSNSTTAPGSQSNTPAPQIVTTSVKEALKGELYSQPFAVTGGTAPLVWSLPTEPKEIPWLVIDSSSGALSGTPLEALVSGKSFVVQVKDNDGRSDQKTFTLIVRECTSQDEGQSFPCHVPNSDACIEGTRTCTGGQLGECTASGVSTSTDYCGSSCLTCGTSADTCSDGRCQCGTDDPCGKADTTKPDCCTEQTGSVCTNLLTDPNHCGDCATECNKESVHVVSTCEDGSCVTPAPCQPGYARCPVGSIAESCLTETASDPNNCGACDHKCPSNTDLVGKHAVPAGTPCQGGQCKIVCTNNLGQTAVQDVAQNCNGNIYDGCECLPPVDGRVTCSDIGQVCTPACDLAAGLTVLCKVSSLNDGKWTCESPNKFIQCVSSDPSSCVQNGADTTDGNGRIIRSDNCGWCGHTCTAPGDRNGHVDLGGKVSCIREKGTCKQECDPIEEGNISSRALCYGRCVSLATDLNNCGFCGHICENPHGSTNCINGHCSPTCSDGYADCDGNVLNGCETQLHTNANCSFCGHACGSSQYCGQDLVCTGREGTSCHLTPWQCLFPSGGGGGQ